MRTKGILADILQGMRKGQISDAAWTALQGRVLGNYTGSSGKLQRLPAGVPDPRLDEEPFSSHAINYIVHRHQLRVCQSFCNAVMHCQRQGQRLYVSVANDEIKDGGGAALTDELRTTLLKKSNLRQIQNLPSSLPLYKSMHLLLYSKECVRLQLMNGCLCQLEDIVFADEEVLPAVVYAGEPIALEYMPVQLLLRAIDAKWTLPPSQLPRLPEGFDRRGLFLLAPHTDYFSLKVSGDAKVNVRRTHFRVVPADSRIVYAAQGEGFEAYIPDLARPPGMSKEVHWLANYVMLSRGTSLDAMLILRLCSREELTTGAPAYLQREIDRLLALEAKSWTDLQRRLTALSKELPADVWEVIQDLFGPREVGRLVIGERQQEDSCEQRAKRLRLRGKNPMPPAAPQEHSAVGQNAGAAGSSAPLAPASQPSSVPVAAESIPAESDSAETPSALAQPPDAGATAASSGGTSQRPTHAAQQAAAAAEARVEESVRRGIGDADLVLQMQQRAERQEAAGTADCFGAARADALRERLRRSREAKERADGSAPAAGSTDVAGPPAALAPPAGISALSLPQLLHGPGAEEKPRPFFNLGNSCFVNASLTSIFGVNAFREVLLQAFADADESALTSLWPVATSVSGMHQEPPGIVPAVIEQLRLAVTYVACMRAPTASDDLSRGRSVIPYLLTNRHYHNVQQDAHEFLQALLLHAQAPDMHGLLAGVDAPKLICRDCGCWRLAEPEGFSCICLPLISQEGTLLASVQAAIDAYFVPAEVGVGFHWCCDMDGGCSSERLPLKQQHVSIAPRVLCLQLVRWHAEGIGGALLHDVMCEPEVRCEGARYALRAVICHMGSTPRIGHYTCRIHCPTPAGSWWYYNNSERRLARPGEIDTTAKVAGSVERAYVTFYEQLAA